MFTLTLKDSETADLIYDYILANFDLNNITMKKNLEALKFDFENSDSLYKIFSLSFTNLIIHFYETNILKKILKKNYFYFSDDELTEILYICKSILSDDESNHKKDLIYLSVFDYIKNNSSMNLDGFVQFRLKDYLEILDYLVDLAVNNFVISREYVKFIELLQEYVSSSNSQIDIVHLIYLNKESILLDSSRNPLPINDHIADAKYLSDISFSTNDYCLNTLLNLVPQKLYIHVLDDVDEFISTLKKIFGNRIIFCYNCEICDFYKITSTILHSNNSD